ncbi:MAG: hypothetical protein ACRDUV_16255, partial [Pseudonocardiaceae bacterium]
MFPSPRPGSVDHWAAEELPDRSAASRGELDLEERSALRRVAGLSTELTDVTEVEYRQLRL